MEAREDDHIPWASGRGKPSLSDARARTLQGKRTRNAGSSRGRNGTASLENILVPDPILNYGQDDRRRSSKWKLRLHVLSASRAGRSACRERTNRQTTHRLTLGDSPVKGATLFPIERTTVITGTAQPWLQAGCGGARQCKRESQEKLNRLASRRDPMGVIPNAWLCD